MSLQEEINAAWEQSCVKRAVQDPPFEPADRAIVFAAFEEGYTRAVLKQKEVPCGSAD